MFKYPLRDANGSFISVVILLCAHQRLPSIVQITFRCTSLAYTPSQVTVQEGLEADSEDYERAEETLSQNGGNSDDVPEPNEGKFKE
jgi:hypothetical protein